MVKRWNGICDADKKIYIYGAGNYGKCLYSYLRITNISNSITAFLVSSYKGNTLQLYGIPVLLFEDVKKGFTDRDIIIIAIKDYNVLNNNVLCELNIPVYYLDQEFYQKIPGFICDYCKKKPLVNNKLFFSCFMGRGYTCNCKYIVQHVIESGVDVDIVWELGPGMENNLPASVRTVEIGSPEYYLEWYSSKIIVCNNGVANSMRKREGQYIIDTWHGIGPTKKIGIEVNCDKDNTEAKVFFEKIYSQVDLMTAASDLCVRNYREAFLYKGEIIKSGYPRNDIFFRKDKEQLRNKIRENIGIISSELMVLYAPTYRYEQRNGGELSDMRQQYEFNWSEVKGALFNRFNALPHLVYRFHHVTDRGLNLHGLYEDGIDATDYPDMQELLLAADVLITDYSSSMWDFSLTRKPVFLFYNDAEEVEKEVGFYRYPDEYPYPKGHTTQELCTAIREFDNDDYQKALNQWFAEYGTYDDGHASERVVERIMNVIAHAE